MDNKKQVPPEVAIMVITDAMYAVESLGCSEKLTMAITHLESSKKLVREFIDLPIKLSDK